MSAGPDPNVDVKLIEQTRRQINQLVEEIAKLSEMDLPPGNYYGEFLQRVVSAVAAPAGAVWIRNPQGHLMLMYQINLREVGLDRGENERQMHDELLRQAAVRAEPLLIPPHSSTGQNDAGTSVAGNPTRFVILMAPILVDKTVAGLVEVWQDPDRNPSAQQGFLQFLTRMAQLASSYTRNHQLRTMVGQQQLWTQLEAFARQVHGSLSPMEVSYQTANEGRRLVDCDRVSVAQRMGRRTKVEAISGADIVEKRSNLVRLMEALMDSVLIWGERLVYSGVKDDTLPPKVAMALDNFLAESNSKLLVVLPLKDDREKDKEKPVRSIMMMECFDPAASPEQLIARLEVVGRHATAALYNAAEHKRIPLRYVWQPIAKVQEGLGGKARAITYSIVAGVVLLMLAMIFIPYPLKMDSVGQLLPVDRRYIYAPVEGVVKEVTPVPGQPDVDEGQNLILLHDAQLEFRLGSLLRDIASAEDKIRTYANMQEAGRDPTARIRIQVEREEAQATRDQKKLEFDKQIENTKSDPTRFGYFWLKSPFGGKVLNLDYREQLLNRLVKPNEPLLRIGKVSGIWEIEVKIPQKHIGQVLQGFDPNDPDSKLEVDLLPRSTPTRSFKGILYRRDLAGEATPNRDDNNEAEPVVIALVQLRDKGINQDDELPESLFLTGTEVACKVRCGNKSLGYALFYGVWEFFYEKVIFFF